MKTTTDERADLRRWLALYERDYGPSENGSTALQALDDLDEAVALLWEHLDDHQEANQKHDDGPCPCPLCDCARAFLEEREEE